MTPQRLASAWATALSLRTFTIADFQRRTGYATWTASRLLARLAAAGGLRLAYAPDHGDAFTSRSTVYLAAQVTQTSVCAPRWQRDAVRAMMIMQRFELDAVRRALSVGHPDHGITSFVNELVQDGRLAEYNTGQRFVYAVRRDLRSKPTRAPVLDVPADALVLTKSRLARLLRVVSRLQHYPDVFHVSGGPFPRTQCNANNGLVEIQISRTLSAFASPKDSWLPGTASSRVVVAVLNELEDAEANVQRLDDEWTWHTTWGRVRVPGRASGTADTPFPYPRTYALRTSVLKRNLTVTIAKAERLRSRLLDSVGSALYERRDGSWVNEFAAIGDGLYTC